MQLALVVSVQVRQVGSQATQFPEVVFMKKLPAQMHVEPFKTFGDVHAVQLSLVGPVQLVQCSAHRPLHARWPVYHPRGRD